MKVGDIVISKYDKKNGFDNAFGVIVDSRGVGRKESYVVWSTVSAPVGWWYNDVLEIVAEKI